MDWKSNDHSKTEPESYFKAKDLPFDYRYIQKLEMETV
jgi:hypothetical protein